MSGLMNRGHQLLAAVGLFLAGNASAIEIMVPAYFYPAFNGSAWDTLTTQAALGTPITAIMNPGSGPGTSTNSDYTAAINRFRAAGGKVLGYVPTGYAGASVNAGSTCRPATGTTYSISDVVSCAGRYQSLYQVDGIFLDEMTNTTGATELTYYRSIYNSLHAINLNWRVVGNPGTSLPPAYFDAVAGVTADTVVSFEGTGASYANANPAPGAVGGPASRFAHLVYDVSSASLALQYLQAAPGKNVGSIYITNDNFCQAAATCTSSNSDFNPWDTLPPYFATFAENVRQINANNVPLPPSFLLLGLGLAAFGSRRLTKRKKT
jgi:hypothetical protein